MKLFFTSLLICFTFIGFAQNDFYGKAVYKTKTTFDADRFNNRQMSEEQKKRVLEGMTNMLNKTYILNFNKNESIYKEEEKLEVPGKGNFRFSSMSIGTLYKNTSDKIFLEKKEFFGKNFLIEDDASLPQWEMSGETKKIGNYMCYKAIMLKETNAFDWSRRERPKRGGTKRSRQTPEEKKKPKEVLVTAWYTPQIPISNGPADFWGLPGLILEVNSDRTTILCTEVVLNPNERIEIKQLTKGDKVTRVEYNEIVKKKMKEMREIWRGRRGGRSRR
ncbi:GLPGLI family protein [Tenacibaculum agarivorans]|uniref:GLPGLI family protein n=1 Tax=Tenacibaculum agarivorans TaxID=1908389 RepID=UPI00094B9105|nr:GLPGLI family protein [Tenacibaculum agarivorans]